MCAHSLPLCGGIAEVPSGVRWYRSIGITVAKLVIAYRLCRGGVAERFWRIEGAALEEDFVGNCAIAPAADICERGGSDAAFVAEKHDDDAGHRLFGVHGFAITLRENVLREGELALAKNCAGNGAVGLSKHEERRFPFQGRPLAAERPNFLIRSGEVEGCCGIFCVVHFLRGLQLRAANPALSAIFEADVDPSPLHIDYFEFVFRVGAEKDLGGVVVLLKYGGLRRLDYREIRKKFLRAGVRFEF